MLTIDADMAVQGQLVVLGTVRLEGRFDGAIICSRLEIGPDGYLFGSVVTEDLRVEGQVVGTVRAIRVHLTGSALLEDRLLGPDGGHLSGTRGTGRGAAYPA